MQNPEDDIIRIELEDLPAEPETIIISDEDIAVVTPIEENMERSENIGEINPPEMRCAIDISLIEPGQPWGTCKYCQTPYHKECWDYNGGCAVLGCSGNKKPGAFLPG